MSVAKESRNCPFCLSQVRPDEDKVRCPKCGVVHHADCWKTNGRCSVYGCDGWAAWSDSISTRIAPGTEDAVIIDDAASNETKQVTRCIQCGAEIGSNQVVCQKCSRRSWKYFGENCFGPSVIVLAVAVTGIVMIVKALIA